MQKPILLSIISLALLSGCDRKENGSVTRVPTPAAASSPNAAHTLTPATGNEQQQVNELNPQPVSVAAPDFGNLAVGEKVYKSTCSICHKTGLNGAPRMGSKKDWELRLAQDKEILYKRAIYGYRGNKGSMPSRGSNSRLSEAEVKASVDYIIEHAIPAWSVE